MSYGADLFDHHEAQIFIAELRAAWAADLVAELAKLEGAHRAWTWGVGDPDADPPELPPPPHHVDLRCKPVEFVVTAHPDYPPTEAAATFDLQRSIDGGLSYSSILDTLPTMPTTAREAKGTVFQWMYPTTRTLVAPGTTGAIPLELWAGDKLKVAYTANGAKCFTFHFRAQRTGERAQKGR